MKALVDEGYIVTAGVINMLDTDYETTELLRIPTVTEAPFSPITEQTKNANLEMINKAAIVVVTSVPFGYGNLATLKPQLKLPSGGLELTLLTRFLSRVVTSQAEKQPSCCGRSRIAEPFS